MTFASFFISTPIGSALLAMLAIIAVKACLFFVRIGITFARLALSFLWQIRPRFRIGFFVLWTIASMLLYVFSRDVIDFSGWINQRYLNPVIYDAYDTDNSSETEQAYISVLRRNCTENEFNILISSTKRMADAHNSTVLNFLQVYYSECGLNPFACYKNEKGDTTAAGHIQFTAAGVSGLLLNNEPVTMNHVRAAIRLRDIVFLTELGESYMKRAANGRALKRPCDVYTAVFMPAFVGASDETVIASLDGRNPQHYYRNCKPLDGWKIASNGAILHGAQYRDGKITIKDLAIALSFKKSILLKNGEK